MSEPGKSVEPLLEQLFEVLTRLARGEFGARMERSLDGSARDALAYVVNSTVEEVAELVTELKRTQQTLDCTNRRLSSVLKAVPNAVIVFDRDGTIEFHNERTIRLAGFSRVEHLADVVGDRAWARLRRSMASGSADIVFEIDSSSRAADGPPVEIRAVPHDDVEGSWVAVISRITERRRAERLKDEFVSNVSHELRTPLTSIKGAIGLLESGAAGERAPTLLRLAKSNADRLHRLVDDLLDLRKLEAGYGMNLSVGPVEVGQTVLARIPELNALAETRGYRVYAEIDETEIWCRADEARIVQVLENLVTNSLRHAPELTTVEVRVSRDESAVIIRVSDDGPGVPPEFRDDLFERFTKANVGPLSASGGTGLGLSICRAIMSAHDGTIELDTDVDQGASFVCRFPIEGPDDRAAGF